MSEQWVTETGIPCFRPHVRRDKDGNVLYEVKPADLPEIATNSNRLTVDLHGSKPPVTEGHRNFAKEAKEADQPLVLGYQDNFRVGELPDGTPCVLCDRHYVAQYADRAKRHPYSSVDYLPGRKAIVGLAKLTRPPELNLGGVFYPGTSEPVYVYAADMAAGTPELTPEQQAGADQVYKYLCSKNKWMTHYAAQYEAAFPSGNNTHVPTASGGKDNEDKPVSNAATATPAASAVETELVQKYEASQGEVAKLRSEVDAMKVDKILDGLVTYQFDKDAERTALLAADEAGRKAIVDRIKKYHPQVTPERIEVYSGQINPRQPAGEITPAQADQIVTYATQHKCGYDEAKKAVLAGK